MRNPLISATSVFLCLAITTPFAGEETAADIIIGEWVCQNSVETEEWRAHYSTADVYRSNGEYSSSGSMVLEVYEGSSKGERLTGSFDYFGRWSLDGSIKERLGYDDDFFGRQPVGGWPIGNSVVAITVQGGTTRITGGSSGNPISVNGIPDGVPAELEIVMLNLLESDVRVPGYSMHYKCIKRQEEHNKSLNVTSATVAAPAR